MVIRSPWVPGAAPTCTAERGGQQPHSRLIFNFVLYHCLSFFGLFRGRKVISGSDACFITGVPLLISFSAGLVIIRVIRVNKEEIIIVVIVSGGASRVACGNFTISTLKPTA